MTNIRKEQLFPSTNQIDEFLKIDNVGGSPGLPAIDGSQLLNLPTVDASDATSIQGIVPGQFVRVDEPSQITTGSLTFNNNRKLKFGGATSMSLYNDINNNFIDIAGSSKLFIRDSATGYATKFTFDVQNGTMSCTEVKIGENNKSIRWDNIDNAMMFDTNTGDAKMLGITNETLSPNGGIELSNGLKLIWMTVVTTSDDNQTFTWSEGGFTTCFGAWTAGGVIGSTDSNHVVVVSYEGSSVTVNRQDDINMNATTKVFGIGI